MENARAIIILSERRIFSKRRRKSITMMTEHKNENPRDIYDDETTIENKKAPRDFKVWKMKRDTWESVE